MRVLYLYPTPRQQIYRQVLSAEGPDVQLYGLNYMESLGIKAEFQDGARKHSLSEHAFRLINRLMAHFTGIGFNMGQAIERLHDSREYDVVFATTDSVGLPFAFLRLLRLAKVPLVIASQGLTSWAKERGMNWAFRLHRRLLQYADRIVYYGRGEGEELQRRFGVPGRKLVWIPIGTDPKFFSPSNMITEDVVLSAGRDHFRDYRLLFEVASCMPLKFRVITAPHCLSGLTVPGNVEILFDVPIEVVREHYSKSRLIVLPLKDTGYSMGSMTLLQCLSMARPVILTRVAAIGLDGSGYSIRDRVNCRLVPPGDKEALRQAILELWEDREQGIKLGRAGRITIEREYTTQRFAERLAAVLKQVCN